jgi:hypothetical protein
MPKGFSWPHSCLDVHDRVPDGIAVFGMMVSDLCMYLCFGRHVIAEALKSGSLAKTVIPLKDEITLYNETIGAI